MSHLILDINDCNIRIWQAGQLALESPGYAWLEGGQYQFGDEARSQARRHPREINHRFWWQLNVEPLQPAFGSARHSADLVHAHLLRIAQQAGNPAELIIAAPGSFNREQLSLLLGIVEQCPFNAVGIVDRAVASCAAVATPGECRHVDLQLHQALITRMTLAGEHLQRESATPIPGCGWLALQDTIGNTIADAFINQTRFDPRRKAASEQDLYDQIPAVLLQLQTLDVCNLEVDGHRVRLEGRILAEACASHYQRLSQALNTGADQLIFDPTLARLPGVDSYFPQAMVLEQNSLVTTVAQQPERILGGAEGVHFITRLAASTATVEPPTVRVATEQSTTPEVLPEPTRTSGCQISVVAGDYTVHPQDGPAPLVNGREVHQPTLLRAGDVLDLNDGKQLHLVDAGTPDGSQT